MMPRHLKSVNSNFTSSAESNSSHLEFVSALPGVGGERISLMLEIDKT